MHGANANENAHKDTYIRDSVFECPSVSFFFLFFRSLHKSLLNLPSALFPFPSPSLPSFTMKFSLKAVALGALLASAAVAAPVDVEKRDSNSDRIAACFVGQVDLELQCTSPFIKQTLDK